MRAHFRSVEGIKFPEKKQNFFCKEDKQKISLQQAKLYNSCNNQVPRTLLFGMISSLHYFGNQWRSYGLVFGSTFFTNNIMLSFHGCK